LRVSEQRSWPRSAGQLGCVERQGRSLFEYPEHGEKTLSFPGAYTRPGGDVGVAAPQNLAADHAPRLLWKSGSPWIGDDDVSQQVVQLLQGQALQQTIGHDRRRHFAMKLDFRLRDREFFPVDPEIRLLVSALASWKSDQRLAVGRDNLPGRVFGSHLLARLQDRLQQPRDPSDATRWRIFDRSGPTALPRPSIVWHFEQVPTFVPKKIRWPAAASPSFDNNCFQDSVCSCGGRAPVDCCKIRFTASLAVG